MLLPEDQALLAGTRAGWEPLKGARILLTGGTGFVGKWLVSAFVNANRTHGLAAELVVLSRDPETFREACRDLAADDAVTLVGGDVRAAIQCGACTHVIHAATSSDPGMNADRANEMLSVIEDGTRNVLELAVKWDVTRLLLVSSGAVYLPPGPATGYAEDSPLGPDWPLEESAYHAGKRRAEALARRAAAGGLTTTTARLFAFIGPYLPLDRHFAVGNFLGDALAGRPVRIMGDGSPVRSYMYAAEMAAWLWTMLADDRAAGGTFNVGSAQALSLRQVAGSVARAVHPSVPVTVLGATSAERDVYLPDMGRAAERLGLVPGVDLGEALRRTTSWYRATSSEGPGA